MADTAFKVGEVVTNEKKDTGMYHPRIVEAIVGDRLIVKNGSHEPYYSLHTLDGKFLGHWWGATTRATAKPFYVKDDAADASFYNIVNKPVVLFNEVYKSGDTDSEFRTDNAYKGQTFEDTLGMLVKVDDVVSYYSVEDFKKTSYYKDLQK